MLPAVVIGAMTGAKWPSIVIRMRAVQGAWHVRNKATTDTDLAAGIMRWDAAGESAWAREMRAAAAFLGIDGA